MNSDLLHAFRELLGSGPIDQLYQIAVKLTGKKVVHINSTKEGGGVAEILVKLVPLKCALGIDARWETIQGNEEFFACTKQFHNLLQGFYANHPSGAMLAAYEEGAKMNAELLRPLIEDADVVIIHDPQPLPLIQFFPKRKGKWIWRCHIDCSHPDRVTWRYLRHFIEQYDASIFSLEDFAQPLSHPSFLIPPGIDPFSLKNIELKDDEIDRVYNRFGIDRTRPVILQVSRFDRFKDPHGVIEAYRLTKKFFPTLQLVYAGGGATDDPEGNAIYQEVLEKAGKDPDIHILFVETDNHLINALQRGADIVLQKSTKEGFGLTVTEALWKSKPVIGGNTGGIRLQVHNHETGYLVNTPEGAALRIRYLLQNPQKIKQMGESGKRLVKDNFLITRQLREHLTIMSALLFPAGDTLDFTQRRQ